MHKYFLLISTLVVLSVGCKLTDGFDEEPMYVTIDSIDVDLSDKNVFPTHIVKDVWVYVDGFNVGVFPLPAKVPVLGNGDRVEVIVGPGIRNNGLQFSPKEFPFYERNTFDLEFNPGAEESLDVNFSYIDLVKFGFVENFEGDHLFTLDLDSNPDSRMYVSPDTPFGNGCGKIDVRDSLNVFLQATSEAYSTDVFSSSEVYLEMDYRCTIEFQVALVGMTNGVSNNLPIITLFKSDEWSKLYLDLSAELNGGRFDSYRILLAGVGNGNIGEIYVDNMRIVYI